MPDPLDLIREIDEKRKLWQGAWYENFDSAIDCMGDERETHKGIFWIQDDGEICEVDLADSKEVCTYLISLHNNYEKLRALALAGIELHEKCKKLTPELQEDFEKAVESLAKQSRAGAELADAVKYEVTTEGASMGTRDALTKYHEATKDI